MTDRGTSGSPGGDEGDQRSAAQAYRTSVGLAALAFAAATVAGFVYGARVDALVIGFLLLATAIAWGVLWLGARRSVVHDSVRLRPRIWIARVSCVVGFALAIVLAIAAAVVD